MKQLHGPFDKIRGYVIIQRNLIIGYIFVVYAMLISFHTISRILFLHQVMFIFYKLNILRSCEILKEEASNKEKEDNNLPDSFLSS